MALLLGLLALVPAQASAQPSTAIAQQRFRQGQTSYDAGRYAGALEHFRASLESSDSPNARLYVARCLRQLGRLSEAVLEYEWTVQVATERARQLSRYAATEQAARKELAELEPRIARLTLRLETPPPGTEVFLQGIQLTRAAFGIPLPVMPGPVSIVVQAPGHERLERQVTLSAGEAHVEPLNLVAMPAFSAAPPALPAPTRWERKAGWISAGVGAAGLATFGACSWLADKRFDSLLEQCGGGPCPSELQSSVQGGRRLQRAAHVSLGVGLLGAAAAGVFFGINASRGDITAVPTGRGVAVQGRF